METIPELERNNIVSAIMKSFKSQTKTKLTIYEWTNLYDHLKYCFTAGYDKGRIDQTRKTTHCQEIILRKKDKNGKIIEKFFPSQSYAANFIGVGKSSIHKALKNNRKCKEYEVIKKD